ncbi:haloacid dehalogenase type II [Bradyrhizobium sp. 1(2017)]|uniref:haloacid dehalogenase type II n=1 Tax=Bradyrhizobium sp. 1(2017) TaxID=1404888 RepID=UPI00140EFB45|nr:haloacid dehalogenase type II [Bradyrhizobium sp. 1(2017)]QIO32296.1 haloacid dehalogenase type II [Bradyrhizobium sp. 1(2017)]
MNAEHDDPEVDSISRRSILGFTAATAALPISIRIGAAQAATAAPPSPSGIKAMTFDVQGTLFDYYQPFTRISTTLNNRKALHLNWSGFLGEWNAGAVSIIQTVIAGKRKWIPPGQIFRESLETVLSTRGLTNQLDEADRVELMSVWAQMVPWHDSAEGVRRLKRKVTVAALSNAGMAGVIALAKRGGLSFDAVLTGELIHSYKPSPDVYQAASTYLGFPPGEIMMVAAHKFDLKAAKAAGFKTAYIPRPLETGPEMKVDRSPESYIDVVADDLIDLSKKIDLS